MLIHHDSRPYEVAASEARNKALNIIEGKIEQGKQNALKVIEHVQTNQPVDYIAKLPVLDFRPDDNGVYIQMPEAPMMQLHRNALGQAAQKADIPMAYIDTLASEKQFDLIATNFNRRFEDRKGRALLRTLGSQVRGFLSDKYRRIDSRPIVDAFIAQLHKLGALPYEGYVTDTKISIQAIDTHIYEPIPNEIMAFVYNLSTSDYGNGALEFNTSVLRIWCTNLAMGQEMLRQVHLGKRLDEKLVYSQQTYELDSQTVVSALGDTIQYALSDGNKTAYLDGIVEAHNQKIDPYKVKDLLQKRLGKETTAQVIEAFNSPDVEMLPAGNSNWRMSNAISWIAGKEADAERKLDIMKVAGEWLKIDQKAA